MPNIIFSLSSYLVFIAVLQFLSAQAPYSMKGLLVGLFYLSGGVSAIFFQFLPKVFEIAIFSNLGTLNCMFWYILLTCIVIALILFSMSVMTICCYKNRVRDDNLPNQQFFAENYYDRQLRDSDSNSGVSTSLTQYT